MVLYKIWIAKKQSVLRKSKLMFHVLPTDCDFNLHMTNSRYYSFMDLGRIALLGQTKLLPTLMKLRWGPVLVACELSFLRPLNPWQEFSLTTKLVYWDEYYFYFEQRFEKRGTLYAIGMAKGALLARGKKVLTKDFFDLAGETPKQPAEPVTIKNWKLLTEAKKKLRVKP